MTLYARLSTINMTSDWQIRSTKANPQIFTTLIFGAISNTPNAYVKAYDN